MARSSYPAKNGKVSHHVHGTIVLKPYDHEAITQAYQLLIKGSPTPYTTESLALAVGINRNKLHYGFKQVYGLTIFAFQVQQYMQKATILLATTDLPIKTIAALVGYSNSSDFGYAFKKHIGQTPTEYRRQITTIENDNSNEAA
jgi:AraC family transcriptional activator of pyochelin receptor